MNHEEHKEDGKMFLAFFVASVPFVVHVGGSRYAND
jgi:hypothetical protein